MVFRNALRAGAVVGSLSSLAFAQNLNGVDPSFISAGCKGETTISTPDGLSRVDTDCDVYDGIVTVEWKDMGDNGLSSAISFTNLKDITDGLVFRDSRNDSGNAQTMPPLSIDARSIWSVGGQLSFEGFGNLKMPQFASLISADEIIFSDVTFFEQAIFDSSTFQSLQEVQTISFIGTNVWEIGNHWDTPLKLTNNTAAAGAASIVAQNNSQLGLVHILGWDETHVSVNISDNENPVNVDMPDVRSATLRLEGIDGLSADNLSQISPSLPVASGKPARRQETAYGTSSITDSGLTQLSLPSLQSIDGTLEILNNSQLSSVMFGQLQRVTGDLQIAGNAIENIDLGQLNPDNLGGELNVAAAPNFSCNSLGISGDAVTCGNGAEQNIAGSASSSEEDGNDNGDSNESNDSEDSSGDSSSGGLSAGAKAGIGVGVGLGVLLLALLAFFLYRRRSRSSRALDSGAYDKDVAPSEAATSPTGYSKVPSEMRTEEVGRPVSGRFSYDAANHTPGTDAGVGRVSDDRGRHRRHASDAVELEEQQGERFEMEEQQGMRHEMDARSLPDIDLDDESPERRSLEDIERSRNSGPRTVGMGSQTGPVSPVE